MAVIEVVLVFNLKVIITTHYYIFCYYFLCDVKFLGRLLLLARPREHHLWTTPD